MPYCSVKQMSECAFEAKGKERTACSPKMSQFYT